MLNEVTDTPSATQEPESEKTKVNSRTALWKNVVFWVSFAALSIIIILASIPRAMLPDGQPMVSYRGRDIYVAIIGANTEREPLGLGSVWPKTQLKPGTDTSKGDIATKTFTNSTDYFYELYDGAHAGTANHDPYVRGFDYSKLVGPGVKAKVGEGKLTAQDNIWAIAANITEEDDEHIPILISRNVDVKAIERAIASGIRTNDFETRIEVGKGIYKTPFGDKGFVCVRKGGGVFNIRSNHATIGNILGCEELPPRDPAKPPIVYLMP